MACIPGLDKKTYPFYKAFGRGISGPAFYSAELAIHAASSYSLNRIQADLRITHQGKIRQWQLIKIRYFLSFGSANNLVIFKISNPLNRAFILFPFKDIQEFYYSFFALSDYDIIKIRI